MASRQAKRSTSGPKRPTSRPKPRPGAAKTPSFDPTTRSPKATTARPFKGPQTCSCGHDHDHVPPEDQERFGTASDDGSASAFSDVIEFLRYLDDINRAITQTELPCGEFIDLLRDLDETGVAMKRLDQSKVEGLGPAKRSDLLRYFLTDVFLTKMRVQREIAPLESLGLIKVAEIENNGPISPRAYPVFHRMFLGFMQTVIAAHLSTGRGAGTELPLDPSEGILPDPALLDSLWSDEDVEVLGFTNYDLEDGLWSLISPVDMLKLTSTAVMAYLTWRDPKMGEVLVLEGLAALCPPAFILMGCTRTFWALTKGLVTHRALLRKARDDGSGSRGAGFFFVLTKDGQDWQDR